MCRETVEPSSALDDASSMAPSDADGPSQRRTWSAPRSFSSSAIADAAIADAAIADAANANADANANAGDNHERVLGDIRQCVRTACRFVACSVSAVRRLLLDKLPPSARILLKLIRLSSSVLPVLFAVLCLSNHGFRRTVRFWASAAPILVRYHLLRWKHRLVLNTPNDIYENRILPQFHAQTAPQVVDIVTRMGGIYVKIGQFLATVGATMIDDAYVQALKPLQDGIPPRPINEIAAIIESSFDDIAMNDIFESFEQSPVGAASIAQAHRARLRHPVTVLSAVDNNNNNVTIQDVIVKVQYPTVAATYKSDFDNLEWIVWLILPERMETISMMRKRHEQELDFRSEANNLRQCTRNLQRHRLEPQQVRIPRVVDGLVSKNVLVMEFLEGTSLKIAMEQEMQQIATALGMSGADELRTKLLKRLMQQFLEDSASGIADTAWVDTDMTASIQSPSAEDPVRSRIHHHHDLRSMSSGTESPIARPLQHSVQDTNKSSNLQTIIRFGKLAAPVLRRYASLMQHGKIAVTKSVNGLIRARQIASFGRWQPAFRSLPTSLSSTNIDLTEVIKTMVFVHGVQILLDGIYNADPHPGNILILDDGRLGLIDYGMVGRLDTDDRDMIASTLLAIKDGDSRTVVDNYKKSGFTIEWRKDGRDHDDVVYHRFAELHLDRLNMSPVRIDDGEVWPFGRLFRSSLIRSTNEWIEQVKRVSALFMGVATQSGRSISLAKEWAPIARRYLSTRRVDRRDAVVSSS